MNDSFIDQISASSKTADKEVIEIQKEVVSLLVFSMNDSTFALYSSDSREILREVPVYPLPFVPDYVNGVLNRHGDPYTVVDPLVMLGKGFQESQLFIVTNTPDDQLCLRITDVLEFFSVEKEKIVTLPESSGIAFFHGTVIWQDKEIPVININSFEQKLRKDLESA